MTSDDELWTLIEQARLGDLAALERVLFLRYDRVLAHVEARLPPATRPLLDAEDVLQQTFAQAFRDIRSFEPRGPTSFDAWLLTIADHRLQDGVRGLKRLKRGGEHRIVADEVIGSRGSLVALFDMIADEDAARASQIARRDESLHALQVAIATLPDDQRVALLLHHVEGLTIDAAAVEMGRTADSVRGLVQRAKAGLRDALGRASAWLSEG